MYHLPNCLPNCQRALPNRGEPPLNEGDSEWVIKRVTGISSARPSMRAKWGRAKKEHINGIRSRGGAAN